MSRIAFHSLLLPILVVIGLTSAVQAQEEDSPKPNDPKAPIGHVLRVFEKQNNAPVVELDRPNEKPRIFIKSRAHFAEIQIIKTANSLQIGDQLTIFDSLDKTMLASIVEINVEVNAEKRVATVRLHGTMQSAMWLRSGCKVYRKMPVQKKPKVVGLAQAIIVGVSENSRKVFLCQLANRRSFRESESAYLVSNTGIWVARLRIESVSGMKLIATFVEKNSLASTMKLEGQTVISGPIESSSHETIDALEKRVDRMSAQLTCLGEMRKHIKEGLQQAQTSLLARQVKLMRENHKNRQKPAILIKEIGFELVFTNAPKGALITKIHKNTFADHLGFLPGDFLIKANDTNLDSESSLRRVLTQQVVSFRGFSASDDGVLRNWRHIRPKAWLGKKAKKR